MRAHTRDIALPLNSIETAKEHATLPVMGAGVGGPGDMGMVEPKESSDIIAPDPSPLPSENKGPDPCIGVIPPEPADPNRSFPLRGVSASIRLIEESRLPDMCGESASLSLLEATRRNPRLGCRESLRRVASFP
jgi:hypothetical protein